MKFEGDILLSFVVAKDGTEKEVAVARSSHTEFDNASVACVAARQYGPAMQDNQPVEYDRQIAIHWSVR
jgi:TonB family protein